MRARILAAVLTAMSLFAAAPASAYFYKVIITGEVEFNQINGGLLGDANTGDTVEASFILDVREFNNSNNFPTRGYIMDPNSFSLSFGGGPSIGLQNPTSPSDVPQFIIRNDDPAVDGFFLGSNVDGFNNGVALDQAGIFDAFRFNFLVTYNDDPLASLNLANATGLYGFDGLTNFNMTIDDGPFNAMGMVFDTMSIQKVPVPAAWIMMVSGLLALGRWRKSAV